MSSLLGYWVHNKTGDPGKLRAWSAEEIGDFFNHVERIQPTASLFHETLEWAVEAKKRVPSCHVTFRHYIDEKRGVSEGDIWKKWTVQQHLDEFMPFHRPGISLNMWNEPHPELNELEAFAQKASDVMNAFGRQGVSLDMINWSVGTPHEGDETIQRLEALWEAFDLWYDFHSAGHHEYGTHRGMLFSEPNGDFNVFPWRVGRAVELIHPKVIALGYQGFRVNFTEYGSDYAFDGMGGRRGYRNYWGGKRFGQEVVGSIETTKRPYVIGYCLYKKGNSSGWGDFDTLGDSDFQTEIEAGVTNGRLAPVVEVTPPPPPPPPPVPNYPKPPDVNDPRWRHVIASPKGDWVNVRSVPDKGVTALLRIRAADELYILREETYGVWIPVKIPTDEGVFVRGWVSGDVVVFDDVKPPSPPDPPTKTVEISRADAMLLADQYEALRAKWYEIANR